MAVYVPQKKDRTQLAVTAQALIVETPGLLACVNATAPATQAAFGALVGLRAGDAVTGILLRNSTAAAGTAPTTARFGLLDATGKVLVLSANANAAASWGVGPIQFAFTAPFTVPADGGYYLAFVVNGTWGTTQPTPARAPSVVGGLAAISGGVPLFITVTSQTDLPAINSSLALTASASPYYMAAY